MTTELDPERQSRQTRFREPARNGLTRMEWLTLASEIAFFAAMLWAAYILESHLIGVLAGLSAVTTVFSVRLARLDPRMAAFLERVEALEKAGRNLS